MTWASWLRALCISECILIKWGLKEQGIYEWCSFFRYFRMYPYKMRIESILIYQACKMPGIISECILIKWGLKEDCVLEKDCKWFYFRMYPYKMRIERYPMLLQVYTRYLISECILIKWGLKVITRSLRCVFCRFQNVSL